MKLLHPTEPNARMCLVRKPTDIETGVDEINRLLAVLQQKDPAAQWQSCIPGHKKTHVYYAKQTCCCLFKAGKFTWRNTNIIQSPQVQDLGLSPYWAEFRFDLNKSGGGKKRPLPVLAPLAVMLDSQSAASSLSIEDCPTRDQLPDHCLLTLSTGMDLTRQIQALNKFRCLFDVVNTQQPQYGSRLQQPQWEVISENCEN